MTELDLLKYILFGALFIYVLFYTTWIYYIAFMGIKTHQEALKKHRWQWRGLYPFFMFGYALDILLQMTFGTIAFRELPKEWLLSGRVNRHQDESTGWRLERANFLCGYFLKPFDKSHCK